MLHPDTLSVAIPFIEAFEGVRTEAYLCPAGVPTICAGLTRYPNGTPVRLGDVCSETTCSGYLRAMLEQEFAPCMGRIPGFVKFGPSRQAALLSFAWNMGANFYGSPGFDTISKVLAEKDYGGMRAALMLYCKAGGQVLAGLERRRKEEADLWDEEENQPLEATALQDTWLKICAVGSECLVEGPGKIAVLKGGVLPIKEIRQVDAYDHSLFVLQDTGKKWHAYMPHWELNSAKKN